MTGGVQIVRSLTRIVKKMPLAIYLKGMCVVIPSNAVLGVWLQARRPKGFSEIDKVSYWGLPIYARYMGAQIGSSDV